MLNLEFARFSHHGRLRENNEDYLGCALPATPAEARSRGWLFALADGVGGQDLGEVASRVAVETLLAGFRESGGGEPHSSLLPRLVQAANAEVYETGMALCRSGSRMATTLVACALRYDHAVVAHAGDSRCYLIRRGAATPLTRDHTVANEQLSMGLLTAREAAGVATRHVLTRSLGSGLFVGVETSDHQVMEDDILLLCSDGLHGSVGEPDMARLAGRAADLDAAARGLAALANERDGSDNISVLLVRVRGVERVGMYRGRPYRLH